MRLGPYIAAICIGCSAFNGAAADPFAPFADAAARIDYGFYAEEPSLIEAARDSLERAAESDAAARYYSALGAYRLAGLRGAGTPQARAWLTECAAVAPSGDQVPTAVAAEAWILAAACAVAQGRRAEQALARAGAIDPSNPRLALVAALQAGGGEALAGVVPAFEARAGAEGPRWGEAEALALLARARLAEGRTQAARDLLERALLIAPDYRFALDLREQVLRPR